MAVPEDWVMAASKKSSKRRAKQINGAAAKIANPVHGRGRFLPAAAPRANVNPFDYLPMT